MSKKKCINKWLCPVELLCIKVSQKDSKPKLKIWLHLLWLSKSQPQSKENSQYGLVDLSYPPFKLSKVCGLLKKISKNMVQVLSKLNADLFIVSYVRFNLLRLKSIKKKKKDRKKDRQKDRADAWCIAYIRYGLHRGGGTPDRWHSLQHVWSRGQVQSEPTWMGERHRILSGHAKERDGQCK